MKSTVILLAGGSGSRMKAGINKVLLPIGGIPCICRSAEAFRAYADKMTVVCREDDLSVIRALISDLSFPFPVDYITGGKTRQESVYNALTQINCSPDDIVLIHDGARCFVDSFTIENVLNSVAFFGSGIPCVAIADTVKRKANDGSVLETLCRDSLTAVQTPQGFLFSDILNAYKYANVKSFFGTDDASVMEFYGHKVYLSQGSKNNIKLTTGDDLMMADALINNLHEPEYRVGHGYDVHRFEKERKLILCGVEIPFDKGLLGHSDADVAVHALSDALLGSVGLGDIGKHFPDTEQAYKDISSLKILEQVCGMLKKKNASVLNADITIVAQQPKISPYIEKMRETVSKTMNISIDRISIKATTTEKLGFEGRMEGISAQAVCCVRLS